MCALLAGIACEAQSKNSDTLCFSVETVQKLLIAGKQKKALDSLVVSLNADIASYQTIIREEQAKDSVNTEIVKTYVSMISVKDEQRKILEGQINSLNKEVKKWKRKTRWTGIAGILATVGGIVATVFVLK